MPYILINTMFGSILIRTSDNASIPQDPTNGDYQDYLSWVAAGSPSVWQAPRP